MQTLVRMAKAAAYSGSGMAGTVLMIVFFTSWSVHSASAFSDSFSDGIIASAVWTGDVSNWTVVANSTAGPGATGSYTLRLNTTTATAGIQQLRTQIAVWGTSQRWSFWFGRRAQSATASNRLVFWLYSTEADLTGTAADGYALTFGDDTGDDEIRIVRFDNGVETALATSATAVPNNSTDYGIVVCVERSDTGVWRLFTSTLAALSSGGGIAADAATAAPVFLQAVATDTTYTPSSNGYTGIVASHTSAANPRSGVEFDEFSFTGFASFVADVRVLMEGAYAGGGSMSTHLLNQGLIPAVQPYAAGPYYYAGAETATAAVPSAVDWVLVALLTGREPGAAVARRAGLLLSDGRIASSGGGDLCFAEVECAERYYIAVYHRNHLAVLGAASVSPDSPGVISCDFTNGQSTSDEFPEARKEVEPGVWAAAVGDVDASGVVDAADRVAVRNDAGLLGYRNTDLSLDGIVNAVDRVLSRRNSFRTSQIP